MIVVIFYLVTGFLVRVFIDFTAATASSAEKSLCDKIDSQTQDIRQRTIDNLANLFPSINERKFHSPSFESLLNDAVIVTPTYMENMINNTLNEIHSWKEEVFGWTARENPDRNQETVPPKEDISNEYRPILNELLESHEKRCRQRRLRNHPRWAVYFMFVYLRYYIFDALTPSLFSFFVIALLLGWIDETWILNLLRSMGS